MTNDTSTLQGSLDEMKDQLIYQLGQKGVTATYSQSTGLLGLISQISNIQTGGTGVPCYKIEFTSKSMTYGDWNFSTNSQESLLEVYLQYQYEPYANATVTISDGTNSYTTTTDSNGYGTVTVPLTENSTTFTATYTGTSDTITVTKSTYLFKDACTSASGLSKYDESIPIYKSTTGNPSCVLSYDSTNNCYEIHSTNTSSSYYSMCAINDSNVVGATNYVASIEIMGIGTGTTNEVGLYCDNSQDTTSYGYGTTILCNSGNHYGKRFKETSVSTSHTTNLSALQKNKWYTLELIVTDTKFYENLYDADHNLLNSYEYSQAVSNKTLGIIQKGGNVSATSNRIRNIKIRSIS